MSERAAVVRPQPEVEMALTRGEVLTARNGSTPSAAATRRLCEACRTPLKPTQNRTCSPKCSRRLGSLSRKRPAAGDKVDTNAVTTSAKQPRTPTPTTRLDSLLAGLPPEVLAVELHGWRCVRV
jgi:hypothetical protein